MPGFFQRAAYTCVVSVLCCGPAAQALSRVTLRNGFTYDCARQQAVDGAHTRLFFSEGLEGSYVDVATEEIVAVDRLPAAPPISLPASAVAAGPSLPDVLALLSSAGHQHNIDTELLASVIHAESGGRAHAVSHAGAQGLMQLMPATAHKLGVADSLQPDQNINGGTTYLDWLLTRYHDNLALALAAYNAGPGAVDRYRGIPPFRETQVYVARVMTEFKRRKQALTQKAAVHTAQASR